MSDSKIIVPNFGETEDDRPLPERVASLYQFKLAFQDKDGVRFYAVQDWLLGIVPNTNVRNRWSQMKRRYPHLYTSCVQMPYKTSYGTTVPMDHANAETLYMITQRMEANSGNRDAVLLYLAKAGVVLDELIRDPGKAEEMFAQLADDKEYRNLLRDGFSPEEARQWLETRRSQKAEWKRLTDEWKARGISDRFEYGRLGNDVHKVATGKTATVAKRELGITNTPRDVLSAADNAAIEIVSTTSRILHRQRDSVGVDDLSSDINAVKPIIDAARAEIDKVFSQKPRRLPPGKPNHSA